MMPTIRVPTVRRPGAVLVLALALAVVVGGCGNLTSGGVGEVELYAVADDPEPQATPAVTAPVSLSDLAATYAQRQQGDGIEGTLTFRVQASILTEDRQWLELTDGPTEVTVDLQGMQEAILAAAPVPEGRYRRIRTVFGRVEAEVVRGLDIDGEPITGTIRVDLGESGFLEVEEAVDLRVGEGETARLLLDLNARFWLRLTDRVQRRVAGHDFTDVVRVRMR